MSSFKSIFLCCIQPTEHIDEVNSNFEGLQASNPPIMSSNGNEYKEATTNVNIEKKPMSTKHLSRKGTSSMYKALKSYKIDKESVGRGSFAVVYKATRVKDAQSVALKFISKAMLDEEKQPVKFINREIKILKSLRHEKVIKLHDFLETPSNYVIVTDFAFGGQLLEAVYTVPGFSEKDGQTVVKQILLGLEYLHNNDIVHRDIKPENVLIMQPLFVWSEIQIKIADFGFAVILGTGTNSGLLTTTCGTPTYAAPEILLGKGYGKAVDMWSLGIMLYFLMSGYTPFQSSDINSLVEVIELAQLAFLHEDFDDISDLVKDLITKLLVPMPSQRLTAQQTLKHDWFKVDFNGFSEDNEADISNLSQNLQPKLIRNKDTTKLMRNAVAKLRVVSAFSKAISLSNMAKDLNSSDDKSKSSTSNSQPNFLPPTLTIANFSHTNASHTSILSSGSQLDMDASF